MQYLLTEKEMQDLKSDTDYLRLSKSVKRNLKQVFNRLCPRITDTTLYCEDCPIYDMFNEHRTHKVRVCSLNKHLRNETPSFQRV
ncbi:MAG: hypothetical protein KAS32_16210 [Candidatus Peribacteraceae bacterium]|nr:hypothetical protein [Candidatus Peribacteraceae bacterium]